MPDKTPGKLASIVLISDLPNQAEWMEPPPLYEKGGDPHETQQTDLLFSSDQTGEDFKKILVTRIFGQNFYFSSS